MKAKMEKMENKQLRDRVERQLEWEPEVTSTDIGVAAAEGVITLSGNVASYTEKLAAERAAKKTFGVRAVANDIQVTPVLKITDSEIAAAAVKALDLRVDIPKGRIKPVVKDGFIHISGAVDWKFQKDAAGHAVEHLAGAKGVFNNIEVVKLVSNSEVQKEIEEAFRRNAELEARRLTVTSHESTVDLWGNVHNWNEKQEAERAAWAAPGVTKVNNYLHIVP